MSEPTEVVERQFCCECKNERDVQTLVVKRFNAKGQATAWRCRPCIRAANALFRSKAPSFGSTEDRCRWFNAQLTKQPDEIMNNARLRSQEYSRAESESNDEEEIPFYTIGQLKNLDVFAGDEEGLTTFLANCTRTKIHPESQQKLFGYSSFRERKKASRKTGRAEEQTLEGDAKVKKEKSAGAQRPKPKGTEGREAKPKALAKAFAAKCDKKLEALDARVNTALGLSAACETEGIRDCFVPSIFIQNLDALKDDLQSYRENIATAKSECDKQKCEKLMKDCSESEKAHTELSDTINGARWQSNVNVDTANVHRQVLLSCSRASGSTLIRHFHK